ncbi:efflux RND transporter periplasmic adaptor subunit [Dokdonella soli]|uniref:Efflux RND transporter periplasmic adaptor subunit n=1 Tax=Dokdonella soli TaxID=529810 RepID=A0ABN1IBP8_9GAMM
MRTSPRFIVYGAIGIAVLAIAVLALRPQARTNVAAAASDSPAFVHKGSALFVPQDSALRQSLDIGSVAEQSLQAPMSAPAVIEADPARLARILPPLSGRIVALQVRLGDAIQVGQPLFTIDSADLAQARSDLQHAEAQLRLTQHALDRANDLRAHEIAATKEVEQAEADHASAASDLERAKARLAQLGIAPNAKESPRVLTVKSPIAGRVVDLAATPGTYANDNTAALMTIADLSTVWFTASVQEKDLSAIKVGEAIAATLSAYPGETFKGTVKFIGDMLDSDTRTVKVRIAFDNPERRLKPGMFANVQFVGETHTALTLPTTALVQNEEKTLVYVETSPWTFEPREILAGPHIGGLTEVRQGVKSGERIVTRNGVLFHD